MRYEPLYSEIQTIKKTLEDPEKGLSKTVSYILENKHRVITTKFILSAQKMHNCMQCELDLIRALLIKFDRKMKNMQSEVTDLKARRIRDNFHIHNFPYKQGDVGHTRSN